MDDLISRQAAIDAVMNTEPVFSVDLIPHQKTSDIIYAINELPSAQPKQKTYQWGRQILFNDGYGGVKVGYACPACKTYVPNKGNYCSNCGAKFTKR